MVGLKILALVSFATSALANSSSIKYTGPTPSPHEDLGGLPTIPTAQHALASKAIQGASYNHQPMLHRIPGEAFVVSWKQSPYDEDEDGQRVMFTTSPTGLSDWADERVLFPGLAASSYNRELGKVHLCPSPFVYFDNRTYAVATAGGHMKDARGQAVGENQLEIYPPGSSVWPYILIRRVEVSSGDNDDSSSEGSAVRLGPMYWAGGATPLGFTNASLQTGIRPLSEADPETQGDMARFRSAPAETYSSPQQACRSGPCQDIDALKKTCPSCPRGERTVYPLTEDKDVILYRSSGCTPPPLEKGGPSPTSSSSSASCVLWASTSTRRPTDNGVQWSTPVPTSIPDLQSNLNAGVLPDSQRFLISNLVPRPAFFDAPCNRTTQLREPLAITLSSDGGATFDRAFAIVNTTTPKRFCGSAKSIGPSYPQARAVAGEGGSLDGLWIAYSINKEDVGVTRIPFSALSKDGSTSKEKEEEEDEEDESTPQRLSVARTNGIGVGVDDLLLFAGGYTDGAGKVKSAAVDIYNTSSKTWARPQSMSTGRTLFSGAALGDVALFGCGETDGVKSESDSLDVFNSSSGQWHIEHLSQARKKCSAASVTLSKDPKTGAVAEGKVLFAGGWPLGEHAPGNVVDIFDYSTRAWSTSALSQGRMYMSAASVAPYVIFAGGLAASGDSDRVDIFDARTGAWSTSSLVRPQREGAAVGTRTKAIFYGGGHAQLFDPVTKTFAVRNYTGYGWAKMVATVVSSSNTSDPRGDRRFALFSGGVGCPGNECGTTECYDDVTGEWFLVHPPLGIPRQYAMAASQHGVAIIAGGLNRSKLSTAAVDLYTYDELARQSAAASAAKARPSTPSSTPAVIQSTFSCPLPLVNTSIGAAVGLDGTAILADLSGANGTRDPRVVTLSFANDNDGKAGSGRGGGGRCVWNTTAGALQAGVVEGCATTWGDKLAVFAGGHDNAGKYSAQIDTFSLARSTTRSSPIGVPVEHHYDTYLQKQWSGQLPVGRELLGCASNGDFTLLAGGKPPHPPAPYGETKRVDIWNHGSNAWTYHNMSVERKKVEAVSVGGEILLGGGEIGHHPAASVPGPGRLGVGGYSASVDIFTVKDQSWRVEELALPRQYFATASAGGKAFFAGGFANNNAMQSGNSSPPPLGAGFRSSLVDIYDSATQTWLEPAYLSVNRSNLMGTSVLDRWVVFAGGTVQVPRVMPSDAVDIYDTKLDKVSQGGQRRRR